MLKIYGHQLKAKGSATDPSTCPEIWNNLARFLRIITWGKLTLFVFVFSIFLHLLHILFQQNQNQFKDSAPRLHICAYITVFFLATFCSFCRRWCSTNRLSKASKNFCNLMVFWWFSLYNMRLFLLCTLVYKKGPLVTDLLHENTNIILPVCPLFESTWQPVLSEMPNRLLDCLSRTRKRLSNNINVTLTFYIFSSTYSGKIAFLCFGYLGYR